MILAMARKWGFTKGGAPRGYAVVRQGDPLPKLRAEDTVMPDPNAPAPAEPKAPSNVIYIYDVIGFDWWSGGGVTADQVMKDLAALGESAEVHVRINSPGGDVFEGIAIFNALARHKGKVTVHVDALSASIASLVQLAGHEILVAENAMLMLHLPWTITLGDADDHRQEADILDKVWLAMAATYSRRTGMTAAAIRKKVQDAPFGEWWLTAEEAVKAGFADGVEKPSAVQAMAEGGRFKAGPAELHTAADAAPAGGAAVAAGDPPAPVRAVPVLEAPKVVRDDAERRRRIAQVAALGS